MPSTTADARCCEFCGKPLDFKEVKPPVIPTSRDKRGKRAKLKPLRLYLPCSCDEAAKALEEREQAAEAKRLEDERDDFYGRLKRAGVKERYKKATHEKASDLAAKVAEGQSLYIFGPYGTGKTHLASAIARKLVWAHKRVRMMTSIELTMELQATIGSPSSEKAVMDALASRPVLIIDDLGKEPPTDWVLSRLFAIINERYDSTLPTVITTNYDREHLVERLGRKGDTDTAEALASRLFQMCIDVPLDGEDRRLA